MLEIGMENIFVCHVPNLKYSFMYRNILFKTNLKISEDFILYSGPNKQ